MCQVAFLSAHYSAKLLDVVTGLLFCLHADMASMDSTEGFDDTTMEMLSANLPSSAFTTNTPDPRLERARQEMERTNQITPLLKEELRLRILSKRLQKGEPEIEINPGEPRSYELTDEEKAKRERRKAQNRRAAKKCREKRKMKTLTDSEKYRIIREENQQLRNDVTYLLHKQEVYKKFCIEHILHDKCSSWPAGDPHRHNLLALLGTNTRSGHQQTSATSTSSTSRPDPGIHSHPSQIKPTTSSSAENTSNYQNQGQATFTSVPMTLPSTAAQAILQAEQTVTSMGELKELPVHEISSLLPQEPDFSVSDQSLESTPPGRSPSNLFTTMSPNSACATLCGLTSHSYFGQLTPGTSFSSNNNTTSFSSSNDDIYVVSSSDNNVLLNSSFLDSNLSSSDLDQEISTEYLQGRANDQVSMTFSPAGSHGEMGSALNFLTHVPSQDVPPSKHGGTSPYSIASGNISATDDQNVFSVPVTNSVIVNTAFFSEEAHYSQTFLSNYLSDEHLDAMTDNFTNSDETLVLQTVPISPLTPLSPQSPYITPSPNVSQSPVSPSYLSTDVTRQDVIQPPTSISYHNPISPKPETAARPIVRRMSSSTSMPSPYSNHHVSIGLSPPPSVPSPTSNGVPESPPILALSSTCAEIAYIPQISSFCTAPSTDGYHVRLLEQDFN